MDVILGSHVSFKKNDQLVGSILEALSYGANTFMFYTGAPQNTARSLIDNSLTKEAMELMRENGIDPSNVIVHAPYIVGLGADKAIAQISKCLNKVIDRTTKVTILLETMAGKGSEIGSSFEEIKAIIDRVNYNDKIGVCLDTCHINDAGYSLEDFDGILDQFDQVIGLDKLKCVHINDSKNPIAAHKDRHENMGYGTIGFEPLIKVIYHDKLKNVPKILETPYISKEENGKDRSFPPYKFEIEMIKNKKFNHHLIEDIQNYYK